MGSGCLYTVCDQAESLQRHKSGQAAGNRVFLISRDLWCGGVWGGAEGRREWAFFFWYSTHNAEIENATSKSQRANNHTMIHARPRRVAHIKKKAHGLKQKKKKKKKQHAHPNQKQRCPTSDVHQRSLHRAYDNKKKHQQPLVGVCACACVYHSAAAIQ